jgi:glucokinase
VALAVGVDIGGTKIAAELTEAVIIEVVHALVARHAVTAVGIGAAGWIANDRATVLFSPHLAWRNEPLRDALSDRIGQPVLVENDANAAAWAEYRFGAAVGHPVVACVTLGTGIGGGLILDGEQYRGTNGIAPEWGHMCLVPDGRLCACGNRGCWEMYASGRALMREAREIVAESPVAGARLLARAGSIEELDGPIVTATAAEGDPAAISICTTVGRWFGRGLANVAAVLDPSIFVIGGGVSAAGDLLLRPAREEFANSLSGRGFRPVAPVVAAALGADAGLIGAADLARTTLT